MHWGSSILEKFLHEYICNHEDLCGVPSIKINCVTSTISLWWSCLQIHCPSHSFTSTSAGHIYHIVGVFRLFYKLHFISSRASCPLVFPYIKSVQSKHSCQYFPSFLHCFLKGRALHVGLQWLNLTSMTTPFNNH